VNFEQVDKSVELGINTKIHILCHEMNCVTSSFKNFVKVHKYTLQISGMN